MNKNKNIALDELRQMLPFGIAANALLLAALLVLSFASGFDYRNFTALLAGNILFVANFLLLGVTSEQVLRRRNEKKAQTLANISYGARYVGIFAVLAGLLILDVITVIPAVLPLFIPRLYYTLYHIFKKGSD